MSLLAIAELSLVITFDKKHNKAWQSQSFLNIVWMWAHIIFVVFGNALNQISSTENDVCNKTCVHSIPKNKVQRLCIGQQNIGRLINNVPCPQLIQLNGHQITAELELWEWELFCWIKKYEIVI